MSTAVDTHRSGALGSATDEQLAELIRRGSKEAFTALYQRHERLVASVAAATSSDRGRVEDITQDAWTSAYRALSRPGAPVTNVTAWLTTIARNVAHDRHRRDRTTPEVADDTIAARTPALGGVEAALEDKQAIGRLMAAFEELGDEQRDILRLREVEGLTYKQIARRLGKTEATIESALFRARRRASTEYQELDSGRRCSAVQAQLLAGAERLPGREHRRLVRHLGRCDSCEHVARLEGAQDLIPAPRLARIAGCLPLPGALARLLTGGTELGPVLGKAAVAAAVAAAGGATLIAGGSAGSSVADTQPVEKGGETTVPAAVASGEARRQAVAPIITRTTKVTVTKRKASGDKPSSVAVTRQPTTSTSTPAAIAAPTPTTTSGSSAPVGTTSPVSRATEPVRRPVQNAIRDTTTTVDRTVSGTGQAVQQTTGAVGQAVQQTTGAVGGAVQQVTQAVPQVTNPPLDAADSVVGGVTGGQGPSVKQTVTCLVASCRIGG